VAKSPAARAAKVKAARVAAAVIFWKDIADGEVGGEGDGKRRRREKKTSGDANKNVSKCKIYLTLFALFA
jgi:hypothetical protein